MAKKPAPEPAAKTPLNVALEMPPAKLADLIAGMLSEEKPPTLDELKGSTTFLDVLAELPPDELARAGYKFTVYSMDRGPRAFLPDSDWETTVPTEGAIAERYGPGLYRVEVRCRRKGQGGGNAPPVTVRIAPPRDPSRPAAASGDQRLYDLLERLVGAHVDRAAAADEREAEAPPPAGLPPELGELMKQLKDGKTDDLPSWLTDLLGKVVTKAMEDEKPAPPAGGSS